MTEPTQKAPLSQWLALGCGGALVFLLLIVGSIVLLAASAMKSSEVYTQAMKQVRGSRAVQKALGEPIEDGFMPSGSINNSNDSGAANLAISLSGPNGSGELLVTAKKGDGSWSFSVLSLQLNETHESINVLRAR